MDKNAGTDGALLLASGSVFLGKVFGAAGSADFSSQDGEIVFQTGMVGYCESFTDPSYHGQILALTYPSIGNYGVPGDFDVEFTMKFESQRIWPACVVVADLSKVFSHWSAKLSLHDWLAKHKVPGLQQVDTRKLVKELRSHGTIAGRMVRFGADAIACKDTRTSYIAKHMRELTEKAESLVNGYEGKRNLVDEVTFRGDWILNKSAFPRVMLVNCGAKQSIVTCLAKRGVRVEVVPYDFDFVANQSEFDGLVLSNGPGNPLDCQVVVNRLKQLFADLEYDKPTFGICLGHQLIGLAAGFPTYKMRFGNRGHNQPCRFMQTQRTLITSQNHGYALNTHSSQCTHKIVDWIDLFVNQNDHSNEGICHVQKPFFSVQFHPEHSAGPDDSEFLFDIFLDSVIQKIEGNNEIDVPSMISRHLNQNQSSLPHHINKVLILGSGGLSIGQAGEFDYSGSQAIKALKNEGIFTILINPNIATVQTSPTLVDRVYLLPVTLHYVREVIKRERPDGIMLMFGGQTALNCGISLEDSGVFRDYNVQVLGPPIQAIREAEDRKLFVEKMEEIDAKVAPSCAVSSVDDALEFAESELGYPILVRAAFALGGLGSGFAHTKRELTELVSKALIHSSQVLLDKSLKGWKEVEYEVVRDIYDNCAVICNMENVDPLGIHTGESIVVAPSQTLNDFEYNKLRSMAIKIVRHLKVVGECNVQYAVNPNNDEFYVIEINPRLSRSSALASKATGYPLAYIAAKLAVGKSLTELTNSVTSSDKFKTTACFEPSLDYCVVKVPRWDLSKFAGVTHEIGSSMKSIGEVMAIGRKFEEAFQKALRMVDDSVTGFDALTNDLDEKKVSRGLETPTDKRVFMLAAAMENNWSIEELHRFTSIDKWFLKKMKNIVSMKIELRKFKAPKLSLNSAEFGRVLLEAKKLGFSDKQIGDLIEETELIVRKARCDHHKILPYVKQVDTVAAEWPANTNYLYLTYNGDEHDISLPNGDGALSNKTLSKSAPSSPTKKQQAPSARQDETNDDDDATHAVDLASATALQEQQQVMVLGSGVYRIGSSVEFDCCAVGCVRKLRKMSKKVIMLNYNPETVSTDFDECDKLYFDEISFEVVMDIYNLEKPMGILLSMGGQLPNNIAMDLHRQKASILGTSPDNIDNAENRFKFSRLLDTYGIGQPVWRELTDLKEAFAFCKQVEYPCIVRPSYVLSGAAMNVAYTDIDLEKFLSQASAVSKEHPVVISKFIIDAKEIDIDAVAQHGQVICMAISEHVENAGVHSGDATLVTPPQDLNPETLAQINQICSQIAEALEVNGPFNLQLIAKDNQLKVIECNLRASRSFPFVSKTLNYDFVATATQVIMGEDVTPIDVAFGQLQPSSNYTPLAQQRIKRVGVKVPQFSFSRLSGADIKLGVEMASTGEVACLGDNRFSAYLKALISTGFRLPERKIVLLSIGSYRQKEEFIPSVVLLARMGYKIYATEGTADYYNIKLSTFLRDRGVDFRLNFIDWPFGDVGSNLTTHDEIDAIAAYLSAKEFDLVINLPMRSAGARRVSTLGYRTRRFAVDHSVPLISDIKCAKLLVEALSIFEGKHPSVTELDCLTSDNIITLPGLIDVHVHVREPGATHKEDFGTATAAALAGGITFIGVMPNTIPPVVDAGTLKLEQQLAQEKAHCDYGLILGATPSNAQAVASLTLTEPVMSLKMYLNNTFGTLCMSNVADWQQHFVHWPAHLPICVHAEGKTASAAILFAQRYNKRVHMCHVSTEEEILFVKHAKAMDIPVTCEVAPHHLFLTADSFVAQSACCGQDKDKLATVKPPLATMRDQMALWQNLDSIDCFATDHAPHLISEKVGEQPPPGFPGLETMLPLLLDATHSKDAQRQLTVNQIVEKLYTNPKRIFNIPDQLDTSIEVDMNATWKIGSEPLFSRSQWTPFAGREVRGKLLKVTLRGKVAFVDGKLLCKPGTGRDLIAERHHQSTLAPEQQQAAALQFAPTTIQMPPILNFNDLPLPTPTMNSLLLAANELIPPGQPRFRSDSCVSQAAVPILMAAGNAVAEKAAAVTAAAVVAGDSLGIVKPQFSTPAHKALRNKHVLSVDMFDRDLLHELFNLAERFLRDLKNNRPIEPLLRGKCMSAMFYENSTRTEHSFSFAMSLLGGFVQNWNQATSSVSKGESLEDTIRTMSGYSNVVVLRHPDPGAVARAALLSSKPVINAGDGTGEHPTQALLDVFTIRKEIGTVSKLIISFVGDLKNGRTVHSLAKLLCNYDITELRFVAPASLEVPAHILAYLHARKVNYSQHTKLDDIITDSDVVYMTRIQQERFTSEELYQQCRGQMQITPQLMKRAKGKKMIVMHPLPRNDEISIEFDNDNRAAYFRQAEYGLYVRMALLTLVLQ